ncbi:MAG: MarR family transcriptional regulator [Anaerolineales bacterium]|nr:MarR family transcriptional regulator [Chloroflexota bacterium]MBL6981617.1 MarR family transcriptional regulator [Anaerolineales bacterium]
MTTSVPISLHDDIPETSLTGVFELIDQTAKNLKRIQRQTVSEANLTPPQYAILNMLWEQDGRPFKEIADALLCTRATITGLMDTLERKGLVVRKPNPEDRRSLLATLTDEGRALQKNTPSLDSIYQSCCTGLSPIEFQQLAFLLSKLNDSLIFPEA